MKTSSLSVLIVTHNCKNDLKRCLDSLYPQIWGGMEVLVFDNASADGTGDMLKKEYPWVRTVFSDQNVGLAPGLRHLAHAAKRDWFLLLNDDTIIPPGAIDRLTEFAQSNHNIGAVSPRIRDGQGNIEYTARKFPSPINALFGRYTFLSRKFPNNPITRSFLNAEAQAEGKPFQCDWGSFAAVLVRKTALESAGSVDPKFFVYWSDADFFYRLKKAGWEIWCYPGVEIIHLEYYRPGRKRSEISVRDFHMGVIRYYFKHHSAKGLNPVFWIGGAALIFRMYLTLVLNRFKRKQS